MHKQSYRTALSEPVTFTCDLCGDDHPRWLPGVCLAQSGRGASRRHLLVLGLCCIAVALAGAALAVLS